MAAKAAAEKRRRMAGQTRNQMEERRRQLRAQTQQMAQQRKVARQQLKASRPKDWKRNAMKMAAKGVTEDFKTIGELVGGEASVVPLETAKKKPKVRVGSLAATRVREIALLARGVR